MKKKIIAFFLIIIMAGAAAHIYISVPEVQKLVGIYTEEGFSEENIYSDLESLSERLDEEILIGSDSFIVYLEDLDISAINRINEYIDGIFGNAETYQQIGVVGNTYKKVVITIKHSTNYYAMQAYLNRSPIPDSETKAKELYEVIRNILDSEITENMTDYEKELALHDYLVTHCRYSDDTSQPAGSDIYLAYGALVNRNAVCNGYAEALQLLFTCVGINSQFVVGTGNGLSHAWNLVELEGKWYHLDATWNDPVPDRGEAIVHPYFNVSDEIMAVEHDWNREDYPAADSMEENYYVKSNTYFYDFDAYSGPAYASLVENENPQYEAVIENYMAQEEDMQFIFENNYQYNSVNWQTFQAGAYCVLVVQAE